MKFIKVGAHYINLYNINHVVRRNENTVEIYFRGGSPGTARAYSFMLNLQGQDAEELERQLNNLCDESL